MKNPEKTVRKAKRKFVLWALLFILVNILGLYLHLTLGAESRRIDEDILSLKVQLQKYNQISKEITEIKKKLQVMDKKVQIIQSLNEARKSASPGKLLDILNARSGLDLQVDMLAQIEGGVRVGGQADDPAILAQFIDRIKTHAWIGEVKFTSRPLATQNRKEKIEFNLQLLQKPDKAPRPGRKVKRKRK